jgi:copper chaperone
MKAGALTFPRWETPHPDEVEKEDDMELEVKGMTCGHCEAAVSRAVRSIDPAATVTVDRAAGRVRIENATAHPAALRQAIEDEGYQVGQPA